MLNTIIDYIDLRGDLSPIQFPYNEIDSLIFSELAYVNLDTIIDLDWHHPLTLKDAFSLYEKRNQELSEEELRPILIESHELFEKMAI